MSSDDIWCMRFFWRRKTLKTRILVSSQAVLHTNNATIGTQNKENHKIFQNKSIHKEIQDHYIATFKKKRREKEGELSGRFISWTQCKKHQSKSSYTNYTQPIKSASHHQRWAKLANQQASDAARDQSKKVGSPPNQIHIIQKREEGEGERMTEKRQRYRGMQEEEEEPVHMKRHRKTHTWCGEERGRESEQSIQMCNSSNEQTETTRCDTHIQNTSDRLPTLDLTVHEQQWRNEEWSKNEYTEREKSR